MSCRVKEPVRARRAPKPSLLRNRPRQATCGGRPASWLSLTYKRAARAYWSARGRRACFATSRCFPAMTNQSPRRFSVHLMPRVRRCSHTLASMASVPDWSSREDSFSRRERLLRPWFRAQDHRFAAPDDAPIAARAAGIQVAGLCIVRRVPTFRSVDGVSRVSPPPHARTWQRLRRRTVPWQSEQTVEDWSIACIR